jgi:hypothetical protein
VKIHIAVFGGKGRAGTEPGRPRSDTERVGLAATLFTVTPEMICEILGLQMRCFD